MARYRYIADKGEVPAETDEEREKRVAIEAQEARDAEWRKEQEEREKHRVGAYL